MCMWSCSFDFIPDGLGSDRKEYPHTVFMTAGTQAVNSGDNYLMLMKLSNLKKLNSAKKAKKDDHPDAMEEDKSGDSDDEDSDASGNSHVDVLSIRICVFISHEHRESVHRIAIVVHILPC